MKRMMISGATALFCASGGMANEFDASMRSYVKAEVLAWASDPVLVAAIRAQNTRHATLGPAEIAQLDDQWQAAGAAPDHPLVARVLENPAADFLRQRQVASAGVISELFVMDRLGLNVAASAATSDYWQGDEAKFTETFGSPPGTMHVGEVEFDESTEGYLGQVSLPVHDPDSGRPIGAITIGLNAETLF